MTEPIIGMSDSPLAPGPECYSCAHCGPPAAKETCRLFATGKALQVLRAWEYRWGRASDPHALCPEHVDSEQVITLRQQLTQRAAP